MESIPFHTESVIGLNTCEVLNLTQFWWWNDPKYIETIKIWFTLHMHGEKDWVNLSTACTTWPNFKVMPSRTKNGHLRGNFLNGLKFGILLTDHQCLSMRSVVKRARKLESTHIIRHMPDHFSGPQDSGWNWNRNVYFLMSQPLPCIK